MTKNIDNLTFKELANMTKNIDNLTFKELTNLLKGASQEKSSESEIDQVLIGKYVIVRTYSSGVWFGILDKKEGKEVIIKEARRLWRWFCNKSISLSANR